MTRNQMVMTLALAVLAGIGCTGRAGESEPAPEFPKEVRWLQSDPLAWKDLKGKVVVLHFWTYGCINCQRNYPVYKNWTEKYKDQKLVLIGVHTPEFKTEQDVVRVQAEAKKNGLTFPIVIDNDSHLWNEWRTRYWPTIFLIDKKGIVRYHWEGELHPEKPEDQRFADRIDELLAEKSP